MRVVLHVRVISPSHRMAEVLRIALDCAGAVNVVRLLGAATSPEGDVVEFSLAREASPRT